MWLKWIALLYFGGCHRKLRLWFAPQCFTTAVQPDTARRMEACCEYTCPVDFSSHSTRILSSSVVIVSLRACDWQTLLCCKQLFLVVLSTIPAFINFFICLIFSLSLCILYLVKCLSPRLLGGTIKYSSINWSIDYVTWLSAYLICLFWPGE